MFKMNFNNIGKLVIYGDGVELMIKTRDLSKVGKLSESGSVNDSYGDQIISFNLSSEPKNARKVNLNRKDNYFVKYKCEYWPEYKTALYVHKSELEFVNLGEFVAADHNGEKDYLFAYRVRFVHGAVIQTLNCERLTVPKDWKIPEEERKNGAHWSRFLGDHNNSYNTITEEERKSYNKLRARRGLPEDTSNIVHWYFTTEEITENYYTSEGYHKIEKNDERKEREKLVEVFKSCGVDVSIYDINKLLAVLNISIK